MCPLKTRFYPVFFVGFGDMSTASKAINVLSMASSTEQGTQSRIDRHFQDDDSSINSAFFEILPENIPNTIITKAPEERFRLGYWSVIALVVNRVIGK